MNLSRSHGLRFNSRLERPRHPFPARTNRCGHGSITDGKQVYFPFDLFRLNPSDGKRLLQSVVCMQDWNKGVIACTACPALLCVICDWMQQSEYTCSCVIQSARREFRGVAHVTAFHVFSDWVLSHFITESRPFHLTHPLRINLVG
jgi:hypothetical protein